MKISNKLALGGAMYALAAGIAYAQTPQPVLEDGQGRAVVDGSGNCVLTSGRVLPECGPPAPAPAKPAEPARPAPPAAPAPPPAPPPGAPRSPAAPCPRQARAVVGAPVGREPGRRALRLRQVGRASGWQARD